jgi:hypothetical protein
MTDADIVCAAVKQKGDEEGGEDKGEIRTAVSSVNSSQIQAIITNCLSK